MWYNLWYIAQNLPVRSHFKNVSFSLHTVKRNFTDDSKEGTDFPAPTITTFQDVQQISYTKFHENRQ
jgi:hypothetical protein